jgi:hypothetical protein
MDINEELNLPVIRGNIPPAKYLSMDDYLKFVSINLKFAAGREKHTIDHKKLAVPGAAFTI